MKRDRPVKARCETQLVRYTSLVCSLRVGRRAFCSSLYRLLGEDQVTWEHPVAQFS